MQIKYRNRNHKLVDKEIQEGRKRRAETVYTKAFHTRQKFGAASKVKIIYSKDKDAEV